MGFFKYLERLRIESELKEQGDIFNFQFEDEIKEFHQKIHTLQETEAYFRERETQFRQWFIQIYIIPKYFTKSISPWI